MRDMLTAICGQLCLLAVDTSTVTTWVTCICSGVIAVTTCLLQVYRMWRDRDDDEPTDTNEHIEEEDEKDNGEE